MARKNGPKNDPTSLTFNTQTRAVMADVAQDNIKEKVNSVREIVSGRSNNEIVLVLQHYDYDVEKTIQAYVENRAKEALQEWQFSGTKPVKKKRNKKKPSGNQPSGSTASPVPVPNVFPRTTKNIPNGPGSTTKLMVNGDITREPVVNGVLDHELDDSPTVEVIANGPTTNTYHVPSTTSSYPTHHAISGAGDPSHFDVSLPNTAISPSQSEPKPPREKRGDRGAHDDKGAKEKSPSPQTQNQRQQHNRQRAHSGSHSHSEGRDRTISTSSTDGKTGKKHAPHLGLERSSKDLHRQTVSLERLRLIFNEEVDRSYKRIKSVFDELRTCLNKREALLLGELTTLKGAGGDVFTMRQGLAHDLKVKIDRAERMSETELSDLRLDIKHFVSDRKIDEDLAKNVRFLYDDALKEHIANFAEVVPVKCQYMPQTTVSSDGSNVASSEPASKPVQHIPQPSVNTTSRSNDKEKKPNSPHLDSNGAHEVAELQRRLKQSLSLGGIPVQTYPERPESAPVSTNSPSTTTNNQPRPGGGRRDNRRRNNRDRPPRQEGPKDDSRASLNTAPGGERVILIGRKTGPQGGSGRPARGGRGRGGGGRGGGSAPVGNRGANNDTNRNNDRDNSKEGSPKSGTAPSPAGSKGPGGSPRRPQPQRENSGSPRRGRGRGQSGGYYRRSNTNPGNNNSTPNAPPNTITEKNEG